MKMRGQYGRVNDESAKAATAWRKVRLTGSCTDSDARDCHLLDAFTERNRDWHCIRQPQEDIAATESVTVVLYAVGVDRPMSLEGKAWVMRGFVPTVSHHAT